MPRPPGTVAERLYREPFTFDFFQAVRLLRRLEGVDRAGPHRDPIHFRSLMSLSFPASAVYDLEPPGPILKRPVMTVTFMGLTGPSGVLPRHYTELLMRLERESRHPEKHALRDWLDLFNTRLIALFWRAWEKYRFPLAYERGGPFAAEPDSFTRALDSLVGLGEPTLRNRLRVTHAPPVADAPARELARADDLVLYFYGGLFARRVRTAAGLEAVLRDYFGLPAQVKQFQGQWLRLEPESQSRVGAADGHSRMGVDLMAGERVWDVQSKLRIRLGPLAAGPFQELLPDRTPQPRRKRFFQLVHLVRLYLGAELDFDVQLVLQAAAVPDCQLPEATGDGPRLGWDSWVSSQTYPEPVGEAVFPGEAPERL